MFSSWSCLPDQLDAFPWRREMPSLRIFKYLFGRRGLLPFFSQFSLRIQAYKMDSGTTNHTKPQTRDRYKSVQSPTTDNSAPVPTGTQIVHNRPGLFKRVKRALHKVKRWPRKLFHKGRPAQQDHSREDLSPATPTIKESPTQPRGSNQSPPPEPMRSNIRDVVDFQGIFSEENFGSVASPPRGSATRTRKTSPSPPRAAKRSYVRKPLDYGDSPHSVSEKGQSQPKHSIKKSPSKAASKTASRGFQSSPETPAFYSEDPEHNPWVNSPLSSPKPPSTATPPSKASFEQHDHSQANINPVPSFVEDSATRCRI